MSPTRPRTIAIVGIAAQFPSGDLAHEDLNYRTFWEFLVNKQEAYQPLTPDLFSSSQFDVSLDKLNLPARGAFLKNYDGLDTVALGISAKDARVMSYAARRLIELSVEAMADSGINYRRQRIGCFMSGIGGFELGGPVSTEGSFASGLSALANRISYILDITGPSIQIDTACSSSLTALHQAILAIEAGDCTAALVGAAQINRELREWADYVACGILSPDGKTKPFDANANGFGRGEGAAVVVIKSLEDAMRDNDHIYSVVLGSAINSTGSLMPLNVPSGVAMKECIEAAYAQAGKKPEEADYVELHITGTFVGDPIEANAAGEVFTRDTDLVVGTVKGNVGHLEAAAFLVSLLKVCLIMETKIIPATVNFSLPSPAIDWKAHRLHVPTGSLPLGCRSPSGRSVISLSGAGIGGSTGHVVIEGPPRRNEVPIMNFADSMVTFIVGGLSPRAVAHISQAIRDTNISDIQTMRACAVTLSRRARQMPWRTYFHAPISIGSGIAAATLSSTTPPPIAFIFSGQGPQHLEMGRVLFAEFPVFRETILELDQVYQREMGVSLLETTGLFGSEGHLTSTPSVALLPSAWPVTITVAAIAMLQMALFDLLASVGIAPSSLAGHSAGETAILYASGAGPKAMAMEVAIARGQSMTVTESSDVGMASLACTAEQAVEILRQVSSDTEDILEISCYNSPSAVAISGMTELLDKVVTLAQTGGIFAQRIRTMVPGHSKLMDRIRDDYMSRMTDIFKKYPGRHVPSVPVFSTCTGQVLVEEFSASYFWENCRKPVLFSPAISNLLDFHGGTNVVFLEISCHPVLSSSILQHGVPEKSVLCPMSRIPLSSHKPLSEHALFTETLARIVLLGYNSCDLSGLYGTSDYKPTFIKHPLASRPIPLPKMHFSYRRQEKMPINGALSTDLLINEETHPLLAQHIINGEPILPATGFIEILLETGAHFLWDLEFLSLFSLSGRKSKRMVLHRSGCNWSLNSADSDSPEKDLEHARGLMDTAPPVKPGSTVDLQSVWDRLPKLEMEGFYQSLKPFADFGPAYQRVRRCHGGPSEVIAEVDAAPMDDSSEQYQLHPAILDACLHIMLHPGISKRYNNEAAFLPAKLGRFIYHSHGRMSGNWFSHIKRRSWYPNSRSYDILVTDESGIPICELHNLLVQKLPVHPSPIDRRFDLVFQPVSVPTVTESRPTYSQRQSHEDEQELFTILDSLALGMISESLQKHGLVVGDDLSRQRYFDFAKRALRDNGGKISAMPDDSEMRKRYPAYFDVTSRISGIHETVFHSSKNAVDALYADDLMARYYNGRSSHISTALPEAIKSFSSLLDSLQSSGKHAINILEVGAGTGLLTKYLIEELEQRSTILAEYTVTDASYAMAAELAHSTRYHKVTSKRYDLTKEPTDQGLLPESYDIIVALHVLHVVPDISSCLSALRTLLLPGGSLVIIELDGTLWGEKVGSIWFDCIFGSFPEWFGFSDGRTHCTMAPVQWTTMLNELGFVNTHASVENEQTGRSFFFTAQKPGLSDISITHDCGLLSESACLMEYSLGGEMQLQTRLRELNLKDSLDVYLVTLQGRDGDSAMGLTVTLRLEFPFWNLRLAIFESVTHLSNAIKFISANTGLYDRGEDVVYFPREGGPWVPRVIASSAPSTVAHNRPIALDDADHLIIEPIASKSTPSSLNSFVGRVMRSHRKLPQDSLVLGITEQNIAPALVVRRGCVVSLGMDDRKGVPDPGDVINLIAPKLILDCLPRCLGPDSYLQVVVAIEDELMSNTVTTYFEGIDAVSLVQCDLKDRETPARVDVVVSDSPTIIQHPNIRHWAPRLGRFLLWDDILRDRIRDGTLNGALSRLRMPQAMLNVTSTPTESLESGTGVHSFLFLPNRNYIVLGGIGGLGVDLAVWMYQHGARHIILTSRRGIASLDQQTDEEALCKIEYLRGCEDLALRLEKCDATNVHDMSLLLKSVSVPIAGCFQMTLVLSDGLFLEQTQANFTAVYDSKVTVFEVFSAEVDMKSLDFYVAFSSMTGLLGHAGQTNYGSACTVLAGILASYRNAFSLVVPGILDAGYLDRADSARVNKTSDAFALSMSAARLWFCLEDGLQKIKDGSLPFSQYIPAGLAWGSFHQSRLPRALHYLLPPHQPARELHTTDSKTEDDVLQIVLSFIEVTREDFDVERPLLSYGLDSLSATRLSSALQPFLQVTQVQILAGVSWSELRSRFQLHPSLDPLRSMDRSAQEIAMDILGVDDADFDPDIPLVAYGLDSLSASKLASALDPYLQVTQLQLLAHITWKELLASASTHVRDPAGSSLAEEESIVEICSGGGIPLIMFAGTTGSLAPLLALGAHFSGTLWGVQVTKSTPLTSFNVHARFVLEMIREKQPQGPYRLATFSGSNLLGVAVTKLLEASGEQVVQLAFIDGFPLLWTNEAFELFLREQELHVVVERSIKQVIDLMRLDPLYGPTNGAVVRLEAALTGSPQAAVTDTKTLAGGRRVAAEFLQFLVGFYSPNVPRSYVAFTDALTAWVLAVQAPLSVVIAEFGLAATMPDGAWADLGAHRCHRPVEKCFVSGVGHLGILSDERTAGFLERW